MATSNEITDGADSSLPPSPSPTTVGLDRDALQLRLKKALLLRDYALARNLEVTDDVIVNLNAAATAPAEEISAHANSIDFAIRALTAQTYPATIETISSPELNKAVSSFVRGLKLLAISGLVIAVLSASAMGVASYSTAIYNIAAWMPPVLAMALGFLGSMTYLYFNFIGIISEKAFNMEDTEANKARLLLGIVFGWIFYFFFCRIEFQKLVPSVTVHVYDDGADISLKPVNAFYLLLPFLVGFSTKLVVGILNQAVRATELTLGLENKAVQLSQRKVRTGRNTS